MNGIVGFLGSFIFSGFFRYARLAWPRCSSWTCFCAVFLCFSVKCFEAVANNQGIVSRLCVCLSGGVLVLGLMHRSCRSLGSRLSLSFLVGLVSSAWSCYVNGDCSSLHRFSDSVGMDIFSSV